MAITSLMQSLLAIDRREWALYAQAAINRLAELEAGPKQQSLWSGS
jgi:hypothetical protein